MKKRVIKKWRKVIGPRKRRKVIKKQKPRDDTAYIAEHYDIVSRKGTSAHGGIPSGHDHHYVVKVKHGEDRHASSFIERLDAREGKKTVKVKAVRRQVKADGRDVEIVKCKLTRVRMKSGNWRLKLSGGITGDEWLDASWHAADCFWYVRFYGWEVHKGKRTEKREHDYFWIPGIEMSRALKELGWL